MSEIDKVYASIADFLAPEVHDLMRKMERYCGSPIERMLGTALIFVDRISPQPWPLIFCLQDEQEHYGTEARVLIPQYRWENRRVDWLFREPPFEIFIECDGHDFHERTKLQAARDRRRDRDAQRDGKIMLRFTGSEIFADPVACANEVFSIVSDLYVARAS